jgi:hypothetical protein
VFWGQNDHILWGICLDVRPIPEIGGIDIELLRLVTSSLDLGEEGEEEDVLFDRPLKPKFDEENEENTEDFLADSESRFEAN